MYLRRKCHKCQVASRTISLFTSVFLKHFSDVRSFNLGGVAMSIFKFLNVAQTEGHELQNQFVFTNLSDDIIIVLVIMLCFYLLLLPLCYGNEREVFEFCFKIRKQCNDDYNCWRTDCLM